VRIDAHQHVARGEPGPISGRWGDHGDHDPAGPTVLPLQPALGAWAVTPIHALRWAPAVRAARGRAEGEREHAPEASARPVPDILMMHIPSRDLVSWQPRSRDPVLNYTARRGCASILIHLRRPSSVGALPNHAQRPQLTGA
jgi:hypothetical protein